MFFELLSRLQFLKNPWEHMILDFSTEELVRFKIFPREAIRFQGHKFATELQYISRRSTYR